MKFESSRVTWPHCFEPISDLRAHIMLHWNGYQVEAFRRIYNTRNQIATGYKTQITNIGDKEKANYTALCDFLPLPSTSYNFSSLEYPSRSFYCNCDSNGIGCSSKSCYSELDATNQEVYFGPICSGLDDEAVNVDNLRITSIKSVYDDLFYPSLLNSLDLFEVSMVTIGPTHFEIKNKNNFKIKKNIDYFKKTQPFVFTSQKFKGKTDNTNEKINVNNLSNDDFKVSDNQKIYFIGDQLYFPIFQEYLSLAMGGFEQVQKMNKVLSPGDESCSYQINGFNGNSWNTPTAYSCIEKNIEINFYAHGIPNFSGGCASNYKYVTDVIENEYQRNNKRNCTFILALGQNFNNLNPTLFLNRLLEIKYSILKIQINYNCKFIFASQPFFDDFRKLPIYGFSWHAYLQYNIAKDVFRDVKNVIVLDTLSMTSSFVGMKIHKIGSRGKTPKLAQTLVAQMILKVQNE